jgi:hypothetical protein
MIDYTGRATKQIRNASDNLHRAAGPDWQWMPSPPLSKLLLVLANSIEFHGPRNRAQVESALTDYFDALEENSK